MHDEHEHPMEDQTFDDQPGSCAGTLQALQELQGILE